MCAEFHEATFYVQARANRHICSELGIHFFKNPGKSPWAPQGTPKQPQEPQRDPQGIPKGTPRETRRSHKGPMEPPRGPRATQREPSGPQIQAKGDPKPIHRQPKQAKRINYINKLPINRLRGFFTTSGTHQSNRCVTDTRSKCCRTNTACKKPRHSLADDPPDLPSQSGKTDPRVEYGEHPSN